jgi:hypothetical protein
MKKESKHTKGEWKIDPIQKNYIVCGEGYKNTICKISQIRGVEEAEANAQRIVTAVNGYDELMEGVKTDKATLEHLLLSAKRGFLPHIIEILEAGIAVKENILKQHSQH